jgi:hypothetical protein
VSTPVSSGHLDQDALDARLTPAEWAWVHNGVALLPAFAVAIVALGWLADRVTSPLPTLAVAWVAVWALVLLLRTLDPDRRRDRRMQAVLSRPLREGRHVWAVPDGERVRVYRVVEERRRMPHLWPVVLGHRVRMVAEGREFDADLEAEAAHRWADEAQRRALPQPAARGLARVINERR